MSNQLTKTVTGHVATEKIFVRGDGRTVCSHNDPDVAFLKFIPGQLISAAEMAVLIFPKEEATESTPLPEAEQRNAPIADVERRRPGRPRKNP